MGLGLQVFLEIVDAFKYESDDLSRHNTSLQNRQRASDRTFFFLRLSLLV